MLCTFEGSATYMLSACRLSKVNFEMYAGSAKGGGEGK